MEIGLEMEIELGLEGFTLRQTNFLAVCYLLSNYKSKTNLQAEKCCFKNLLLLRNFALKARLCSDKNMATTRVKRIFSTFRCKRGNRLG